MLDPRHDALSIETHRQSFSISHVPIFLEVAGKFHSTQPTLKAALACAKASFVAPHLEVETYTWDMLPPGLRQGHCADAVARETRWVLEEVG